MANMTRLNAIFEHISALPDATKEQVDPTIPAWDQSKWMALPTVLTDDAGQPMIDGACGTAGCFAGWAVMLYQQNFRLDVSPHDTVMVHDVVLTDENGEEDSWPIGMLARDILNLDDEQADVLFHQNNTLEDIKTIINNIEQGLDPDDGVAHFENHND